MSLNNLSLRDAFNLQMGKYERTRSDESDAFYTSDMDSAYESDLDFIIKSPKLGHILHSRKQTSIGTKIERIKEGRSPGAIARKKKIKQIDSVNSLCSWYWQKPIAHFPFLYFTLTMLSSFVLAMYWFMDNDSCFILCGIISLSMCSYATYKFKISMKLKKEIDEYRQLNMQFKRENRQLEAEVERVENAISILQKTKRRLKKANQKNGQNLQKFEAIEKNLQSVGKKTGIKLNEVNKMAKGLREKWREEYLASERDMYVAITEYNTLCTLVVRK